MNIIVKIIKIVFLSLILTSCQSAKDVLTLKKKESSDEFLVEKKKPFSYAARVWNFTYARKHKSE